jgi:hypothetical protein
MRELLFDAQQQAAIGRTRIVNPIPIGDQAILVTANIQQRRPI